jgi:hypothetical protein
MPLIVPQTPASKPQPFPFPHMQNLKDALTAAALVGLAWIVTVAVFSL